MEDEKRFIALTAFIRRALGYGLEATGAELDDALTVVVAVVDSFLGDVADRLKIDKTDFVEHFCSALIEGQKANEEKKVNERDLN